MKTAQIILEDFGSPSPEPITNEPAGGAVSPNEEEIEAVRLEAYESGYKTGWDDGIRSCEEEARTVAEELGRNLKDMDFTYFEAREELSKSLRAFLEDLLTNLFPSMLAESVAGIAEDILNQAEPAMSGHLEIAVSPDDASVVKRLLSEIDAGSTTLIEEPALASGQAKIRVGEATSVLDADRILSRIRDVLEADMPSERLTAHG